MRNEIKLTSSMEKVFSDMRRGDFRDHRYQTALKGEYVSFQVVLNTYDVGRSLHLHAQAESPLGKCDIWEVGEVPAQLPTYEGCNLGDTFDPNFHEAVMHIEDETLGENVIVQVLQKGYKIGDTVIRAAMVKVAN